jgi:hypothetical protein
MRRRVKLFIATGAAGALLAVGVAAPSVSAAPITCPNGQEAVHRNGHWFCENNGGNGSGAGHHKGTGEKI